MCIKKFFCFKKRKHSHGAHDCQNDGDNGTGTVSLLSDDVSIDTSHTISKRFLVGADIQATEGAVTNTHSGVYMSDGAIFASNGVYGDSDERKKDFAEDIVCDLDVLSKLPKKYFSWKDDESGSRHIGTSAQEVQKIYPELVSTDEDGCLHLSYDKLSIVALAAIDKLREENNALSARIEALEEKRQ